MYVGNTLARKDSLIGVTNLGKQALSDANFINSALMITNYNKPSTPRAWTLLLNISNAFESS